MCELVHVFYPVVTVEFLQPVFTVEEGQGNVSVCLTLDTPTATPLTVSLEATSLSAVGKSALLLCHKHALNDFH